jgi:regulator of sigma E protease
VKLLGEMPEETAGEPPEKTEGEPPGETAQEPAQPAPPTGRELYSKSRPARFLIFVMGAFLNIVLAVVFTAVVYRLGTEVPAYLGEPPLIGWVTKGSPADGKGIQVGDRIREINGKPATTWQDVNLEFTKIGGVKTKLQIERDGSFFDVELVPRVDRKTGLSELGFEPSYPAVIANIDKDMPAYKAGFQNGDRIVNIDGTEIRTIFQGMDIIHSSGDKDLAITVRRGNEAITRTVRPVLIEGEGRIGFSREIPTELKKMGIFPALKQSVLENSEQAFLLYYIIKRLITRDLSLGAVSGPIEIAKFSRRFAQGGFVTLLRFMAFISLQLGILNLLPIPVLDGGHIFILFLEGLFRRDFSMKLKERLMHVGFILLMFFMAVVMFNDILKNIPKGLEKYIPWK